MRDVSIPFSSASKERETERAESRAGFGKKEKRRLLAPFLPLSSFSEGGTIAGKALEVCECAGRCIVWRAAQTNTSVSQIIKKALKAFDFPYFLQGWNFKWGFRDGDAFLTFNGGEK